jgi:WD40 repeat protein
VAFSPDGRSIAVAVESVVLLLNQGGEEKRRIDLGEPVQGIAFSPDSATLAAAAGAARFYAVSSGEETGRAGEQVLGVAFSADGALVALAGKAGLSLVPRPEGAPRSIASAPARDVAFGCEGKCVVAAGEDGVVRAFAIDGGAELWSHAELAPEARLGVAGPLVLAGIGDRRIWALGGVKGNEEWYLEGKTDDLQTFALAPQAKLLATAGEGSTIDLWAWK